MRFRWVPLGAGRSCPLLQVGIRRNGLALPADPLLLVDTGADGTLLHLQMAKFLGFQDADLVTEESGAADGTMTVSVPRDLGNAEVSIGGHWLPLPTLKFGAKVPMSLLGRDFIFAHFELRMIAGEFELRPLAKKK